MSGTAFERIIDQLRAQGKKIKESNGGTKARAECPCHDSQSKASLSITDIGGQALVYDHGGCDTRDVVAALGLTMADLFDDCKGARYDYLGIDGLVSRTVHRSPDKNFYQSGQTGSQPILYRLPEVIQAVREGKAVFLVEGEKDVHALESLGLVATTAPMGASNFDKVDITPLGNAHLVAIPDQDEGGEGWARQVHNRLDGFAASITWMRPAVGKDAADHVAAGYGSGDFEPYAAADAPQGEPPPSRWVSLGQFLDGTYDPPQPDLGAVRDGTRSRRRRTG